MDNTIEIKKIRNYPGTFHVGPRASEQWPWQLAYATRKDGYGAEPGVISIHETKRATNTAFRELRRQILADRAEDSKRYSRLKREGYYRR